MSIAIMTHPDRLDMAKELQEHIGGGVITGVEEKSAWACCRVSYEAYDPEYDFHMVIQDDVWCESTLIEDTRYLLSLLDTPEILSLQDNHLVKDAPWRVASGLNNSRCMVVPSDIVEDWLAWDEANVLSDLRPDDIHMTLFAVAHNKPIYFVNPQLVYQKDVWSVFNEAESTWKAGYYIGDRDVKSVGWDTADILKQRNKPPQAAGLLHKWALGKIDLVYLPTAKFTKSWFLGRKNIRPFEDNDIIITRNSVYKNPKAAITLSPFEDADIPITINANKGKYKMQYRVIFSHLGEKNTLEDLPEGIRDTDKLIKSPSSGSIAFIVKSDGNAIAEVDAGIFFNTSIRNGEFYLELDTDSVISLHINSSVWGNMAVEFAFNLAKI